MKNILLYINIFFILSIALSTVTKADKTNELQSLQIKIPQMHIYFHDIEKSYDEKPSKQRIDITQEVKFINTSDKALKHYTCIEGLDFLDT